ncbi:MAG: hypothetical protein LBQ46_13085 [Treponema sp.]|jgi:hypothetical protein|nr:hypothetical protein [Treponema sp.]
MRRGLGAYIIHVAVALYLLADGVLGLAERSVWQRVRLAAGRTTGNEIVDTLTQVFGTGDLTRTLIILFSVLAIGGGLFLLLELFGLKIRAVGVIILIFLLVWLVFIVLSDLVNAFQNTRNFQFLPWIRVLASHLVVLGALVTASRRFGD